MQTETYVRSAYYGIFGLSTRCSGCWTATVLLLATTAMCCDDNWSDYEGQLEMDCSAGCLFESDLEKDVYDFKKLLARG